MHSDGRGYPGVKNTCPAEPPTDSGELRITLERPAGRRLGSTPEIVSFLYVSKGCRHFCYLKIPGHFEVNSSCCLQRGVSGWHCMPTVCIGSCMCKRFDSGYGSNKFVTVHHLYLGSTYIWLHLILVITLIWFFGAPEFFSAVSWEVDKYW